MEESKMSFWKKIKTSIFGLEEYQKLALQKSSTTIIYLIILMLIFSLFVTIAVTYKFNNAVKNIEQYIEKNIESLEFNDGKLSIKKKTEDTLAIQNDDILNLKVIIDTEKLTEEQIDKYKEEVKNYYNGIIVLQDKIIMKTDMSNIPTTISLEDLTNQFNLVKFEKQDIINVLSSYSLYIAFFIGLFIYLFIINLATVLLDAILYSLIGYITGKISQLRIAFRNVYNIVIYSLTLPIILNLIYMIINILTGYTIKYFSIMYMAITCIYIITAILIIRADLIKKQIELSKIMKEQEKVREEMERKKQEQEEAEEKEKIRKKDEKKRQEEKKKGQGKKNQKDGQEPEPQANISNS